MVGLSTKARLISASALLSPSSTARTISRTRCRSIGTASCGLAMETRLMNRYHHETHEKHEKRKGEGKHVSYFCAFRASYLTMRSYSSCGKCPKLTRSPSL